MINLKAINGTAGPYRDSDRLSKRDFGEPSIGVRNILMFNMLHAKNPPPLLLLLLLHDRSVTLSVPWTSESSLAI